MDQERARLTRSDALVVIVAVGVLLVVGTLTGFDLSTLSLLGWPVGAGLLAGGLILARLRPRPVWRWAADGGLALLSGPILLAGALFIAVLGGAGVSSQSPSASQSLGASGPSGDTTLTPGCVFALLP